MEIQSDELVIVPKVDITSIEQCRLDLHKLFDVDSLSPCQRHELLRITSHMWKVANRNWPEYSPESNGYQPVPMPATAKPPGGE